MPNWHNITPRMEVDGRALSRDESVAERPQSVHNPPPAPIFYIQTTIVTGISDPFVQNVSSHHTVRECQSNFAPTTPTPNSTSYVMSPVVSASIVGRQEDVAERTSRFSKERMQELAEAQTKAISERNEREALERKREEFAEIAEDPLNTIEPFDAETCEYVQFPVKRKTSAKAGEKRRSESVSLHDSATEHYPPELTAFRKTVIANWCRNAEPDPKDDPDYHKYNESYEEDSSSEWEPDKGCTQRGEISVNRLPYDEDDGFESVDSEDEDRIPSSDSPIQSDSVSDSRDSEWYSGECADEVTPLDWIFPDEEMSNRSYFIRTPDGVIPSPPEESFPSIDECADFADRFAKQHGFVLRIITSSSVAKPKSSDASVEDPNSPSCTNSPSGSKSSTQKRYISWGCAVNYRHRTAANPNVTNDEHQNECPFRMCTSVKRGVFTLKVKNGEHNHLQIRDIDKRVFAPNIPDNLKPEVHYLLEFGVSAKWIRLAIRRKYGGIYHITQESIYREAQKLKNQKYRGLSKTESALKLLDASGYQFRFRRDDNNNMHSLFFAHGKSLEMANWFNSVVLLDCTYKTNRYNMPLLSVVGVTNLGTTFNIAFAFLSSEKEESYLWALSTLKAFYKEGRLPKIFVTDRELALMNALPKAFGGEINHVLRLGHIHRDVHRNINTKAVGDKRKEIMRAWVDFVDAKDKGESTKLKKDLMEHIKLFPRLRKYFRKEWLPYSGSFLKVGLKHLLNLGVLTTSRVEGSHASMKRELANSTGDLLTVIDVIAKHVEVKLYDYQDQLRFEQITVTPRFTDTVFRELHRKVSHKCLTLLLKQVDLAKKNTDMFCHNSMECNLGVPCYHKIRARHMDNNGNFTSCIKLEEISQHWHLSIPSVKCLPSAYPIYWQRPQTGKVNIGNESFKKFLQDLEASLDVSKEPRKQFVNRPLVVKRARGGQKAAKQGLFDFPDPESSGSE